MCLNPSILSTVRVVRDGNESKESNVLKGVRTEKGHKSREQAGGQDKIDCIALWREEYVQLDCRSARRTRTFNLPTNQKGYGNFETTVGKLSPRRIQIFRDYFCLGNILKVILNNFQNNAQTKIAPPDSDSSRQIS